MGISIVKKIFTLNFIALGLFASVEHSNDPTRQVDATIDFTQTLQEWDGFGVNYVELAQSTDYENDPQEYGGFSLLSEEERDEVIELIFGEDGLKPSIVKMFYDPFHQEVPGGPFDHETTTRWMRYFVHKGIAKTKERGGDEISIISTLYGPPAWATKQKILRGRDLDPEQFENLAKYMIAWGKFLVEKEKLPLKYLSLHNEGDCVNGWPLDGSHGSIGKGNHHDYNAFWRPTQVAHFLEFMPPMMKAAGLDVGLTPGECATWNKFENHYYHWAIHDNDAAMENISLITSHSFDWPKPLTTKPIDLLRLKRPDLHAWTTSMTWGNMHTQKNYDFVLQMILNIYEAKVNAIIPWACIQTATWETGDPNPHTAFFVSEKGDYEIRPQYYFYKQLTRAGQKGMKVAKVSSNNSRVKLAAFSSNNTAHPDAFLVMNMESEPIAVNLKITGNASSYEAFRTSHDEQYAPLRVQEIQDNKLSYSAPAGSITTFFAKNK
ncbi:hypothetical protein [uncultured Draconibacterium sp.]|uniref:hypothetical protein n=1 Tax=uncultured Draconibacterium sp. TaxID=1573823 RepID=UPI0025DB5BBC|nr:hypothetical protein [uncultured Draconibacterium sp.]